ncbi:putative disease resistance protein At5g47280 [Rutidosis leptorrhynchoides]|uniref:putative disease resistance protein At5g47280 n=1 Tax=Rutidosis leptorrhynchoides TaxID=125765 RepID=UPI003A9A2DEA
MVANWCEEKTVRKHDVMRQLAIHLSSQGPKGHRKRLTINVNGEDLPPLPDAINAHILSISTGERFSMNWNDMQASKVEVFVLNFMSEKYVLPRFMQYIEKLKVLIITNYGYYFSDLENFPPPQYLSSLTRIRLDHVSISSISTQLLEIVNLQKLSLIICKIGNSFNEFTDGIPKKLPNIFELDIESCDDLFTFPKILCTLVRLRKLSITNCHNLTSLTEEFGGLTNLEVLRLASCSDLKTLPDSIVNLKKLIIIDISYCIQLSKLPKGMGELSCLKTIHMTACTGLGLDEISSTFGESCSLEVVCDDEISWLWNHHPTVIKQIVEKDTFGSFSKIVSN